MGAAVWYAVGVVVAIVLIAVFDKFGINKDSCLGCLRAWNYLAEGVLGVGFCVVVWWFLFNWFPEVDSLDNNTCSNTTCTANCPNAGASGETLVQSINVSVAADNTHLICMLIIMAWASLVVRGERNAAATVLLLEAINKKLDTTTAGHGDRLTSQLLSSSGPSSATMGAPRV